MKAPSQDGIVSGNNYVPMDLTLVIKCNRCGAALVTLSVNEFRIVHLIDIVELQQHHCPVKV